MPNTQYLKFKLNLYSVASTYLSHHYKTEKNENFVTVQYNELHP